MATGIRLGSGDIIYGGEKEGDPTRCQLDGGRESETPSEVFAVRRAGSSPDSPGWSVRSVPDCDPILRPQAPGSIDKDPRHQSMPAAGHHEVMALTPQHARSLAQMEASELNTALRALRTRAKQLIDDDVIEHVVMIVNHGREAGSAINHAHAQLFGLPFPTQDIQDELNNCASYSEATGSCILCDQIKATEVDTGTVLVENDKFVSYVPFAARVPFQIMVGPKDHSARFEDTDDKHIARLSEVLSRTMRMLSGALDDPPYNLIINSSPEHEPSDLSFHWHIDIVPRQSILTNFELASDVWFNTVSPEESAKILRGERALHSEDGSN